MYMKPFMVTDQLMFLDFIDLRQASDSWVPAQIKKKPRRRPGPSQQGDLGRFLIYPIRRNVSPGSILARMARAALEEPARKPISRAVLPSVPMLSALLRAAFSVSAFLRIKFRVPRAQGY